MKKIKKIVCVVLITMIMGGVLISCNKNESIQNKVNKYLDNGKQSLSNNDYENAKVNFESALKEEPNNKEALNLCDMVNNYKEAQKDYDNGELEKATEKISQIPPEYKEYAIKSDVDKLIVNIKEKEDSIVNINTKIKEAYALMEGKKYEEAKDMLKSIDLKDATEEQKKRVNDNINFSDKEEAKVKEAAKKVEEKKKQEEIKAEKEKKKQEQIKALEETRKKEQANAIVKQKEQSKEQAVKAKSANNTKQANGEPCIFVSQCGVKLVMPASWRGNYYIRDGKNGLGVYFIPKVKQMGHEVFLFGLSKGTDTNFLDNAKVLNINGQNYAMGGPTDCQICGADKIDYETYHKMDREYGKVKVLSVK